MAYDPATPRARRIAMWSGPRNISTALMRSFGSRGDAFVTDEPLYAHYLSATGRAHPEAERIIATHDADLRRVVRWLVGPIPEGRTVWYQKHMAHHLLPSIERGWLAELEHAFLVREPRAMLASLGAKLKSVRLEDTGLPQQVALFDELQSATGVTPPVVDARRVLLDPKRTLGALCAALDLPFDEAMLSWAPGPRDTDGCWGSVWYENTWKSTGFAPYRERPVELPAELEPVARESELLYARLLQHSL
ncbi:MAG: HAD family hydrolase [Planctomycetota bacterium]